MTVSLLLSMAGPTLGHGPLAIRTASAQTAPPRPPADPAKPEAAQPSQEEVDAGRNHFETGVDFFQRGNYAAARAEFEASYQLTKYPQLLFNLGKTAEKLNQTADAIRYLEAYLASNQSANDAAEVRAKLADLRQRSPSLAATDPIPPPLPTQPRSTPPIPALALLGAGAGLLIIGIGCGAGALADAKSIQNSNGQFYLGPVADTYAQGRTLDAAGIAFDVIGAVALAAGGAWTGYWLYKKRKANPPPASLVAPTPAAALAPGISLIPHGLGIGLAGRF